MNPTARITRILPTSETGQFIIPMVPYDTTEGGMDFRADYCFDKDGLECPLFGICSLVIQNSQVIQANLNCNNIRILSEDTRTNLEVRVSNPTPKGPRKHPYALSSLRENALCTGIPELDPGEQPIKAQATETQLLQKPVVEETTPKKVELEKKPLPEDDPTWVRYPWQDRNDID